MRIEDLYIDDLCENEERIIIDAIASTIEEDGFDISHFSLFSETEHHKKAQVLAQKYGSEVICKIYNCTEKWLNS